MCNECTCQCANQAERIEKMAKNVKNPAVMMNQATYEAISGDALMINGVRVEISNGQSDRQFFVRGET